MIENFKKRICIYGINIIIDSNNYFINKTNQKLILVEKAGLVENVAILLHIIQS